jgi:hypothetical protein
MSLVRGSTDASDTEHAMRGASMSHAVAPVVWRTAIAVALLAGGCGAHTILGDSGLDGGSPDPDARRDAEVDVAPLCRADMVLVPGTMVCVDRHEASQGPAGEALSVAGAEPWTSVTWDDAAAACEASGGGKRLCDEEEWFQACEGPARLAYPYGESYDEDRCNGLEHGAGVPVQTGSMAGCEGGVPGLFDMSGNVWEWVDRCADGLCRVRGGSFNRREVGLRCSADLGFDPAERYGAIGFRCCRDAE